MMRKFKKFAKIFVITTLITVVKLFYSKGNFYTDKRITKTR